MRSLLFSGLALAGLLLLGDAPASAANGCGVKRHYSHHRGGCVWNAPRHYGYGAYHGYGHVPYDAYRRPRVVYGVPPYYAYGAVPYDGYPAAPYYDVQYGPPAYYADPAGFYARTIIYNQNTRYFGLTY
jgi:hypothetical protein